jgi:hypothetical protein
VNELSKQGVPDVSFGGVPTPNPTLKALSDLASQVNGAVLMGHSQSGAFPLAAALLNPAVAKGSSSELGGRPPNFTDEQIKTLATLPSVVFGDHRDTPTGIGIRPSWQPLRGPSTPPIVPRRLAVAQMLSPGETGNRRSHTIMQDKNNPQAADPVPTDRRARQQAKRAARARQVDPRITAMMSVGIAAGHCVDFTVARLLAVQSVPRLALELEDYAALPITADNTDQNTRAQLARVNYLRDEPDSRRFFVNDLNGPLYILDKQTKAFTKYLDFNGLAGRPGLFPKFTYARNFATGLTNVILDPDYARNGVFYTLHMEDPSTPGSTAPRSGVLPGLDLSDYTTTPAVPTPTVNGQIDREVVLVEWKDRNVANITFEGTAREILRVQYPLAPHPLGEMTFNPVARPGDPDWRVVSGTAIRSPASNVTAAD